MFHITTLFYRMEVRFLSYFYSMISNYLSLLFPAELETGESIRLLFLKTSSENTRPLVKYANSFEEVAKLVLKYRNVYNCYVSLATYKDTKPYKRHVLFLDYDQKDFPDFNDAKDYTSYFKSKIPSLFNHALVASGSGGFHFYICCEEGENNEICDLNKQLCKIANADARACTSTQVARIPGSYNLKHEEKKSVLLIHNDMDTGEINRYSLSQLRQIIENHENIDKKKDIYTVPQKTEPMDISNFHCSCFCVNNMLANGVVKGERNFALGRITANLKSEQYTYEKSREMILDWNTRCSPPKTVHETITDFNAYWFNNEYKLLGCSTKDERKNNILRKYCKGDLCQRQKNYTDNTVSENLIYINSLFCNSNNFKQLTAYQYAILLLVGKNRKRFHNFKKLKSDLLMFFSKKIIKKAFDNLIERKLITRLGNTLALKKINSKYNKDISINVYVFASYLKNSSPSNAEFKVYIALRTLLQTKHSVTLESLSSYLDLGKSTISEHIKSLENNGIIKIEKRINERGLFYNYYTFLKFDINSMNKLSK